MANDNRKTNDPSTPSQSGADSGRGGSPTQGQAYPQSPTAGNSGGINPSSPTQGTEPNSRPTMSVGSNPSANRPGTEGGGDLRFRCADVGHKDCPWETSGRSEEDIRQRVGEHGRQHHGLKEWTNEAWDRVRGAIRRAA
jgi:predicted small metal-binding protein